MQLIRWSESERKGGESIALSETLVIMLGSIHTGTSQTTTGNLSRKEAQCFTKPSIKLTTDAKDEGKQTCRDRGQNYTPYLVNITANLTNL